MKNETQIAQKINEKLFFALAKRAFQLPDYIAVYIPSTVDVDKAVDTTPHVTQCQELLSELFGGATTFDAVGCWVSNEKGLVTENVKVVKAFCLSEKYDLCLEAVYQFALQLCHDLAQEAVSIETSRDGLCLVSA